MSSMANLKCRWYIEDKEHKKKDVCLPDLKKEIIALQADTTQQISDL